MSEMKPFAVALAEMVTPARNHLTVILDRNPDLAPEVRAALTRVIGRLHPLCDYQFLEQMRDAYQD